MLDPCLFDGIVDHCFTCKTFGSMVYDRFPVGTFVWEDVWKIGVQPTQLRRRVRVRLGNDFLREGMSKRSISLHFNLICFDLILQNSTSGFMSLLYFLIYVPLIHFQADNSAFQESDGVTGPLTF